MMPNSMCVERKEQRAHSDAQRRNATRSRPRRSQAHGKGLAAGAAQAAARAAELEQAREGVANFDSWPARIARAALRYGRAA
jgi:hypothetical protein